MNKHLLVDNFSYVVDVLKKLDLSDDEDLKRSMSLIAIEIDGVSVNHLNVTAAQAAQLEALHCDAVNTSLHAIVRNALGYYAFAEQPMGTNEPPIGPDYAVSLLNKFQDTHNYPHNDIHQLKDQIFVSLAAYQNEKSVE